MFRKVAGVPTKPPTMANPRFGLVFILYTLLRCKFRLGVRMFQIPLRSEMNQLCCGANSTTGQLTQYSI